MQEMGRVDRSHDAERGARGHYACQNVSTRLSLWIREQRQANPDARDLNGKQLFEVMKALMLPDRCHHEVLEEMFENPETCMSRGPCESLCSHWDGDYKSFSGTISKERLVAHLQTNVFDRGAVRADKFVFFIDR